MNRDGQDEPVQQGFDDSDDEHRLAGIVDQVRNDAEQGTVHDVPAELRTRAGEAGIALGDEELAALAARISAR